MANKRNIMKLSLAVQGQNLKNLFPDSTLWIENSRMTWRANITPSPLSQTYTILLRYMLGKSPSINILGPELTVTNGELLPHTYPGERLCLYYPGIGEWRDNMPISQTIVPWISEWLLHYEIWLATGQWCGGGEHPVRPSRRYRGEMYF